jgi:hypothetical protein
MSGGRYYSACSLLLRSSRNTKNPLTPLFPLDTTILPVSPLFPLDTKIREWGVGSRRRQVPILSDSLYARLHPLSPDYGTQASSHARPAPSVQYVQPALLPHLPQSQQFTLRTTKQGGEGGTQIMRLLASLLPITTVTRELMSARRLSVECGSQAAAFLGRSAGGAANSGSRAPALQGGCAISEFIRAWGGFGMLLRWHLAVGWGQL